MVLVSGVFIFTAAVAEQPSPTSPIVYPKEHSIVGSRVNLVLDPTEIPFFQVLVGKTEYPMIDTSTGKHANQGLELEPGVNTITVNVFAPPPADQKNEGNKNQGAAVEKAAGNGKKQDEEKRVSEGLILVSTWKRQVFSNVDLISAKAPAGFKREPFHSREHETSCSGCHNLDAPPRNAGSPKKPEDMICYVCHRKIPTGKNIHGPVAVWNCIACHDPDLYPVKYQFTSIDPWKVVKTIQAVEPAVFTVRSKELFQNSTATLVPKEKAREALKDALDYLKLNPTDKVRIEVHTDNTTPKMVKSKVKEKVKSVGFKTNQALTAARAKTLASLLKEAGIKAVNLTAVGMGDKLPKRPNTTAEDREINNRVEIVAYPADVKIKNSRELPVLKDRDRVVVSLAYSQGPPINSLTVREKLPKGLQYLKGSGSVGRRGREPKADGEELVWQLGDRETAFSEALSYVVKKSNNSLSVPQQVKLAYTLASGEQIREFDPKTPPRRALTIKETCLRCHEAIAGKKNMHGPVDAGYCVLCHNPHASPYRAWLRKPTWDLCTTCHADLRKGLHVNARFATGKSHPMRKKHDPTKPGKKLNCASCHNPHGSDQEYLFAYNIKNRSDLCGICHTK